jgi:hypothetical protein
MGTFSPLILLRQVVRGAGGAVGGVRVDHGEQALLRRRRDLRVLRRPVVAQGEDGPLPGARGRLALLRAQREKARDRERQIVAQRLLQASDLVLDVDGDPEVRHAVDLQLAETGGAPATSTFAHHRSTKRPSPCSISRTTYSAPEHR